MAKVKRDAFLYLDPEPGIDDFAQCSSCRDWVEGDELCVIHGPRIVIPGTASCGFYVFGDPRSEGSPTYFWMSPRESGLVNRKVRCENCKWFGAEGFCKFYHILNNEMPDIFDLETKVDAKGCCNANEPR